MVEATNNLMQERNGVFVVTPGSEITSAIAEAIECSERESRPITFNFGGVPITVSPESDPELIRIGYVSAWQQMHNGS